MTCLHYQDSDATLYVGDCREVLASLPESSARTCVTSPPYWGLRDYGVPPSVWGGAVDCEHAWESVQYRLERHGDRGETRGLEGSRLHQESTRLGAIESATCGRCGAWLGCLGLEPTPELFVAHLVEVFRAVRRVLTADGTLWLNLGDSYAGSWGAQGRQGKTGALAGRTACAARQVAVAQRRECGTGSLSRTPGLKNKDLVGIPWRVAFALQADGWYLRSDIIWAKPNPMPESVRDRPTKSHEYVFLLAKSERYFYDADAVREPHTMKPQRRPGGHKARQRLGVLPAQTFSTSARTEVGVDGHSAGRNARSVWSIATRPSGVEHFATMPPELAQRCILAGSAVGDTVLDPFSGAGTTGLVAMQHGRRYLGVELNPRYADASVERWGGVQRALFAAGGGR
ncbi:DNA-methyltransferase [Myxococcus faecalis]|uniref:DNA-methyltransferase n=1 Tax=Myxococcus faecalis TaxID=3115646 RepID=UPI003CF6F5D7